MGNLSLIQSQGLHHSFQPKQEQQKDWDQLSCDLKTCDNLEQIEERARICRFKAIVASKCLLSQSVIGKDLKIGEIEKNCPQKRITLTLDYVQQLVKAIEQKRIMMDRVDSLTIDPSKFIKIKQSQIENDFRFMKKIGEGSYGKVVMAQLLNSKDLRAIKMLKKQNISVLTKMSLINQFSLLKRIDHPNIIKLYDMYQDKDHFFVVTELCQGGSLLDFVNTYKLSETVIRSIAIQILKALKYLHRLNILHRDIKLENIVLVKTKEEYRNRLPQINIIDFGISVDLSSTKKQDINSALGSLIYMPPETLREEVELGWDIWSLGILLFIMATGKIPYKFGTTSQLLACILNNQIEWKYTRKLSSQVKHFIQLCLTVDPRLRPSAEDLLNNAWLRQFNAIPLTKSKKRQTIINLTNYESKNNFVSFIESYLSSKRIKQMDRQRLACIFNQIDLNRDGTICEEELKKFCLENGQFEYEELISQIFKKIDKNKSNKIQFNQFITMMQEGNKLFDKQSLGEAFDFFDQTKEGQLSKTRIKKALKGMKKEEFEELFASLDSNSDDLISREEFIDYLTNNQAG